MIQFTFLLRNFAAAFCNWRRACVHPRFISPFNAITW